MLGVLTFNQTEFLGPSEVGLQLRTADEDTVRGTATKELIGQDHQHCKNYPPPAGGRGRGRGRSVMWTEQHNF